MNQTNNPYRGIKSYTKEDKDFFWGRSSQVQELMNMIKNNNLVVLSGDSGCGKTSLINAGLTPKLEGDGFIIIRVCPSEIDLKKDDNEGKERRKDEDKRRTDDENKRKKYVEKFYQHLANEIDNRVCCNDKNDLETNQGSHSNSKLYILSKKSNEVIHVDNWKNKTIWEKLFLYNYVDKYGCKYKFLIIIDQFEEIFQLDLNLKRIINLFRSIDILSNYYVPSYDKIANDSKKELTDANNLFPTEQIYNENSNTYKTEHKFLIAIRKDFLFEFYEYTKYFPYLGSNIYRITHLFDDQADEIIGNGLLFADKTIKDIIISEIVGHNDFVSNDDEKDYYIDTMLLSIILTQLWEDYYNGKDKIEKGKNEMKDEIDRLKNNRDDAKFVKRCKISISQYYNYLIGRFEENMYSIIDNKNRDIFRTYMVKFEEDLLSYDKKYRSVITIGDVLEIFKIKENYRDKVEKILKGEYEKSKESSVFEISKSDQTSRVKLRHDKLCVCAKEHIEANEGIQTNSERYSANVYFTPMGRLDHDNCFIECIFGPWNSYRSIMRTIYFMQGGIHNMLDMSTKFVDNLKKYNAKKEDGKEPTAITTEFSFRNENQKGEHKNIVSVPFDGFTHLKTKTVDSKIYEISFWNMEKGSLCGEKVLFWGEDAYDKAKGYNKEHNCNIVRIEKKTKVNIPAGYFMIIFYYDEFKRLILKDFYKTTNGWDRQHAIINGYTSIHYRYRDDERLPYETYYLDLSKNIKNDTEIDNAKLLTKVDDINESDIDKIKEDIEKKYKVSVSKDRIQKTKKISEQNKNYDIRIYKILDYCNEKYLVSHFKDNNYGYKSKYDEYGRETYREVLYESPDSDTFNLIHFERYDFNGEHTNLIKSISYWNGSLNDVNDSTLDKLKESNCKNVHKVVLHYDEQCRVKKTRYYLNYVSEDDNAPIESTNLIKGEDYIYKDENYILSKYFDPNKKQKINYVMMIKHDSQNDNGDEPCEIVCWLGKEFDLQNKQGRVRIPLKDANGHYIYCRIEDDKDIFMESGYIYKDTNNKRENIKDHDMFSYSIICIWKDSVMYLNNKENICVCNADAKTMENKLNGLLKEVFTNDSENNELSKDVELCKQKPSQIIKALYTQNIKEIKEKIFGV